MRISGSVTRQDKYDPEKILAPKSRRVKAVRDIPDPTPVTEQLTNNLGNPSGYIPGVTPKKTATTVRKPPPAPPLPFIKGGADASTIAQLAAMRVKHREGAGTARLIERVLATLPEPHPLQQRIEASPAKRKVINTGRRVGKTTGGGRVACIKMTEGRRVLLASTTQDQADTFWEKCKDWLDPFIVSGDIQKNETKRTLIMPATGGRIKVKTASDADTLRGDYADFLILDECALLAKSAWDEVAAPMLLDNDGDCWFLSTPRHKNWFFGLYQMAVADVEESKQNGTEPRWAYFHATSFDNPHLSREALNEIIKELSEDAYKQEILAIFLEGEGAVFRNIAACMNATPQRSADHWWHDVVLGGDWGQTNDWTVLSVVCATCRMELALIRYNNLKWDYQLDKVVQAYHFWNIKRGQVESNSIGSPLLERLQDEHHLNISGFDTNKKSKPQAIHQLKLALETVEYQWIDNAVGTSELEAYEAVQSRVTGNIQYSAPKGYHDDTVVARFISLDTAKDVGAGGAQAVSYQSLEGKALEEGSYAVYPRQYDGGMAVSFAQGPAAGYNEAMQVPAGNPFFRG